MNHAIYPETLPAKTASLLQMLSAAKPEFLSKFYLSEGTALSLQIGHRESEDLDFFTPDNFDPTSLQVELAKLGPIDDLELAENTLNGYIQGVKIQFLGYPYPLLEPTVEYESIQLSSVLDIACTKLQTIGMRGSKKDFVDLYVLFEKYSFAQLREQMQYKYIKTEFNMAHLLKSLVYFEDAENQPMPRLHKDIVWDKVKQSMIEVVKTAL